MKKLLIIIASVIVAAFFLESCVATHGSRDEYFGYSNSPEQNKDNVYQEETVVRFDENKEKNWKNPLSEDYEEQRRENKEVVYNNFNNVQYVPVIVPWWDRYYSWFYYPEPVYRVNFAWGHYWGWDWYNPRYYHHPYYGYHWGPYYSPYSHHYGYHGWYHQPYYSYGYHGSPAYKKSKSDRSRRTFGPGRGDLSGGTGSREKSGVRSFGKKSGPASASSARNMSEVSSSAYQEPGRRALKAADIKKVDINSSKPNRASKSSIRTIYDEGARSERKFNKTETFDWFNDNKRSSSSRNTKNVNSIGRERPSSNSSKKYGSPSRSNRGSSYRGGSSRSSSGSRSGYKSSGSSSRSSGSSSRSSGGSRSSGSSRSGSRGSGR